MRKLLLIFVVGFLSTDLYSEDYIPGKPSYDSGDHPPEIGSFWKYKVTDTSGDTSSYFKYLVDGIMRLDTPTVIPTYIMDFYWRDKNGEGIDSSRKYIRDSILYPEIEKPNISFVASYLYVVMDPYFISSTPEYRGYFDYIPELSEYSSVVIDSTIYFNGNAYDSILRIKYSLDNDSLKICDYFLDSLGMIKREADFLNPASGERKSYQLDLIEWETIYSKSSGIKPGTGNPAHNYNEKQLRGMNKTGVPVNILGRRIPGMDMNDKKAVNVIYDPDEGRLKQVFP